MQSKILNDYIVVTKFDKINKGGKSPFQNIVPNNNLGIVVESADDTFAVGDQVYFMSKYERVIMGEGEVYVMKADNIFKVIPGGNDDTEAERRG